MAVVLDGPLDDEARDDLVRGLRTVLGDVRAVDEDADRMAPAPWRWPAGWTGCPPGTTRPDPAQDPAEAAALLRWLADGHFVFLGARDVALPTGRGTHRPRGSRAAAWAAAQRPRGAAPPRRRRARPPSSTC